MREIKKVLKEKRVNEIERKGGLKYGEFVIAKVLTTYYLLYLFIFIIL